MPPSLSYCPTGYLRISLHTDANVAVKSLRYSNGWNNTGSHRTYKSPWWFGCRDWDCWCNYQLEQHKSEPKISRGFVAKVRGKPEVPRRNQSEVWKNEDDGDLNNQMLCFNQTISNSHDKFKLLISCVTALFLFLSFLCDDQTASTLRLARSFIISERNVEYLRQMPYLYVMRVCIYFHYENVRVGEFSLIPFYRCTQLQQRLHLKR